MLRKLSLLYRSTKPFTEFLSGVRQKHRFCASLLVSLVLASPATAETLPSHEPQHQQLLAPYHRVTPNEWGERVTGVKNRLATNERVLVLTLDACGSTKGMGYDQRMIDFLINNRIPATLFMNLRWVEANPAIFAALAANPLFEIANHGAWHKPASVNGKRIYGIQGTASAAELLDEIEINARRIQQLTGTRPRYYRSGTAYYDEVAVAISQKLKHAVIGYSVLGDAGATYTAQQVRHALLQAKPGDIILAHMNHPASGTADGVMAAIPELRKRGYRFVHLHDYPLQ